jgi:hypothetical protein
MAGCGFQGEAHEDRLPCAVAAGAADSDPPLRADDIKEVDYPVQYEVMETTKSQTMVIQKVCSMTLRDKAKPNVAINVTRKGVGSCHIPDSGTVFHGRQNDKKNQIELVILVGEDKARIEAWQIVGTVQMTPNPNPS